MEIELIIKNFFTKIFPKLDVFTGEFYQTLNKDITPILAQSSNIRKYRENVFQPVLWSQPNFDTEILTWHHKTNKLTNPENYKPIFYENGCKTP